MTFGTSQPPTSGVDRRPAPARERWLPGIRTICYGGDYNPEQWPEEVWAEDITLMADAGVNLVSIGIFSWALLEPREGEFDFGWLDRVLERLHAAGIRVDLGTPTASPPAWFFRAYPESRVVARDGAVLGFGSRGMPAPTSAEYRRLAVRITTELARRYGRHPALALWHVHNEYGTPVAEDYSASGRAHFRRWLRTRYASLEALNDAWGTAFWGQWYGSWDEVDAPALAPTTVNPAQRLDFARYSSDVLLDCFRAERDAIRRWSSVPVTTNFMAASCPAVDLWSWAHEVDVVSNDHYLTAADPRNFVGLALAADLTRSVAGRQPWILMEHSTSAVNWQPRNVAKRQGEMRRNALAHLGRGADAIMFFQWRASRSGAEKFHSAMLPQAGTASRVWREVTDLGADLARLAELRGSTVRAPAAVVWDYASHWAQDLEWRPSVDARHRERTEAFYERLWRDGVTTDFVHPEGDLDGYALVVLPAGYLLTARAAANLTRFVRSGGTLVVSFFSGIVDEHDRVHEGPYLSVLREALGLTVEEFLPLRQGERVRLDRDGLVGDVWTEDVTLDGAQVVASYVDGPNPGGAAITRNKLGSGTAWYVSTRLGVDELASVMSAAYEDASIVPSDLPEDVETIGRESPDGTWIVTINHTTAPVAVPTAGLDLLTGSRTDADGHVVAPGGVSVVRVAER